MTLADLTDEEREDYIERASIAEYDGHLSRAEAERLALRCVLRARAPQRLFHADRTEGETYTGAHD